MMLGGNESNKIGVKAIVDTSQFNQGVNQVIDGLKRMEGEVTKAANAMGNAENKTGGLRNSLGGLEGFLIRNKDLLTSFSTTMFGIGTAIFSARQAVDAFKRAYDFTREGAEIQRLEQGTDSLAQTMGGNMQKIIRAVREASMNTVSDYEIMRAVGSGMLFQLGADANQYAELMRIAMYKGRIMGLDTAQAFNDLARGIGRLSPLILDNLGIIIDGETTYAEYAASIGKTADELTAMEKRYAMLERTIREGNRQIAEAGGLIADSLTPYEQFETNIQNVTNSFKKWASEGFAPVVSALNQNLFGVRNSITVMKDQQDQVISSSMSYEEYTKAMEEMAKQYGFLIDNERKLRDMRDERARIIAQNFILTAQQYEMKKAMLEYGQGIYNTQEYINSLIETQGEANTVFMATEETLNGLNVAIAGKYSDAVEKYTEKQDELKEKMREVNERIRELQADRWLSSKEKEELEGLIEKYGELQQKYNDNAEAHREATTQILYDLMQQQLAIEGLTAQEAEFLTNYAQQLGIFSYLDKAIADASRTIGNAFAEGNISMEEANRLLAAIKDYLLTLPPGVEVDMSDLLGDLNLAVPLSGGLLANLSSLPRYIYSRIVTEYITIRSTSGVRQSWGSSGTGANTPVYAFGGGVEMGQPSVVGDAGVPEVFVPMSNGYIYPSKANFEDSIASAVSSAMLKVLPMMQGVTKNYNLSVTTQQSLGNVIYDYSLMRLLE